MKPVNRQSGELSVEDGCLLWGSSIIVPPKGRKQVLQLLQEGHPGVSRIKRIARNVVW